MPIHLLLLINLNMINSSQHGYCFFVVVLTVLYFILRNVSWNTEALTIVSSFVDTIQIAFFFFFKYSAQLLHHSCWADVFLRNLKLQRYMWRQKEKQTEISLQVPTHLWPRRQSLSLLSVIFLKHSSVSPDVILYICGMHIILSTTARSSLCFCHHTRGSPCHCCTLFRPPKASNSLSLMTN